MPAPIVMLVIAAAALVTIDARAQDDARVLAAGSLRAAMTEIEDAFRAASGATVAMDFGASGLLRERI